MPLYIDEEAEDRELQIEKQKIAFHERDRELARRHEQELLKLKLELAGKNKRGLERIDVVQRLALALVKLPTMPLALCTIAVLLICKREVPEFLQAYISL